MFGKVLPLISVVAISLIIMAVVSANAAKLMTSGLLIIAVVMLHNVLGYAFGYGVGRVLGLSKAQMRTLSIEVGMQNSGLATSLALTHFATMPLAAVPGTVFSVWHNISGSILSSWWRNHDDKHEIHWDSDNGEKGSAKSTVSAAHPFDADKAAKVAA